MTLDDFNDLKEGDVIEAFITEKLAVDLGTAGKTA